MQFGLMIIVLIVLQCLHLNRNLHSPARTIAHTLWEAYRVIRGRLSVYVINSFYTALKVCSNFHKIKHNMKMIVQSGICDAIGLIELKDLVLFSLTCVWEGGFLCAQLLMLRFELSQNHKHKLKMIEKVRLFLFPFTVYGTGVPMWGIRVLWAHFYSHLVNINKIYTMLTIRWNKTLSVTKNTLIHYIWRKSICVQYNATYWDVVLLLVAKIPEYTLPFRML